MQTNEIEILNASEIQTPYTRWFFYGETGSGKTQAVSSFPEPFFILPKNENSILTLQGRNIPYTLITNRRDMEKVLRFLTGRYAQMLTHLDAGRDDKAFEVFPWQSVIIENLSHYCEFLVEDISNRGEKQMNQQLWGQLSNHLRNIHSTLSDMDVHTVYTSLATSDEKKGNLPMMTGKNAIIMPSSCDVIAYCETHKAKEGDVYRVHFRKHAGFPARSRFNKFPPYVDNFNFKDFESLIDGDS